MLSRFLMLWFYSTFYSFSDVMILFMNYSFSSLCLTFVWLQLKENGRFWNRQWTKSLPGESEWKEWRIGGKKRSIRSVSAPHQRKKKPCREERTGPSQYMWKVRGNITVCVQRSTHATTEEWQQGDLSTIYQCHINTSGIRVCDAILMGPAQPRWKW